MATIAGPRAASPEEEEAARELRRAHQYRRCYAGIYIAFTSLLFFGACAWAVFSQTPQAFLAAVFLAVLAIHLTRKLVRGLWYAARWSENEQMRIDIQMQGQQLQQQGVAANGGLSDQGRSAFAAFTASRGLAIVQNGGRWSLRNVANPGGATGRAGDAGVIDMPEPAQRSVPAVSSAAWMTSAEAMPPRPGDAECGLASPGAAAAAEGSSAVVFDFGVHPARRSSGGSATISRVEAAASAAAAATGVSVKDAYMAANGGGNDGGGGSAIRGDGGDGLASVVRRGSTAWARLRMVAEEECSVCLMGFEEGVNCFLLPCGHIFHAECITLWLENHASCPVCKRDLEAAGKDPASVLMITPVATPV
ncbi:unnamed protein product [Phaeothamnion confervicola]